MHRILFINVSLIFLVACTPTGSAITPEILPQTVTPAPSQVQIPTVSPSSTQIQPPSPATPSQTAIPLVMVPGVGEMTAAEGMAFTNAIEEYKAAYFLPEDQIISLAVTTVTEDETILEIAITDRGVPLMIKEANGVWMVPGFKDLAPEGFTVGTQFDWWTGYLEHPQFQALFISNFSGAMPGGGLDEALFSRIPQDQTLRVDEIIQYYDWKQFDIVMQLMSDSKKTATIMHIFPGFLDHAHAPDWMRQLTDDELREWIVKHSETIASHLAQYEIEPAAISVVNELMWHGPDRNNPDQVWLEGNYLYSRLHDEFIQLAYATARQLWPESLLLMNDDSSTEGQQTNTPFNTEAQVEFSYIHRMRQQGVSIDGYGYQGHLLARNFLEGNGSIDENIETNLVVYQQQLTELFQQYHSIGALVYVTELDVNTGGLPADWTTQQKETLKARIYTIVFETALESGACPNITTWSFSNAASWVFYDGYPFGPSESPLPFDEDFKPTQSAFEIRRVLLAHR